jgi:hypothetical protein
MNALPLGVPTVGTTSVTFEPEVCLCYFKNNSLVKLAISQVTTSTLPAVVITKDGYELPVYSASTGDPTAANTLLDNIYYLASVIKLPGGYQLQLANL